ncbi:hypothetical protein [Kangiella shandongensis]|uniref:hypothetical protein n=1 Tax=Kangiella shandongensis TaxID=2763258 RepID=UPI001CBFF0BB|nr:hypothetical protein [Kangiella shandongensis]
MFNFNQHVYLLVTKGRAKATELISNEYAEISLPSSTHPRTLMGNFHKTEEAFKKIISKVAPKSFFKLSPVIYLHLFDEVEGDYTDIEVRAFKEAALGAGGRDVFMVNSRRTLTKEQLLGRVFVELEYA